MSFEYGEEMLLRDMLELNPKDSWARFLFDISRIAMDDEDVALLNK